MQFVFSPLQLKKLYTNLFIPSLKHFLQTTCLFCSMQQNQLYTFGDHRSVGSCNNPHQLGSEENKFHELLAQGMKNGD